MQKAHVLHPNQLSSKKRLYQLVKSISTLNMRAMSTASKHLQAALGSIFGLLYVSNRNHRIGISPDNQQRDVQSYQGVAQVDLLPSIIESGISGCDQCLVCTGLRALLVELVYERLLDQARLSEEVCEFSAQVLTGWLGAHQVEHRTINLWPQSGTIDQHQSLYPLRMASCKSKSHCSSERVTDDAHTLPVWTKGVEEVCQELG